MDPQEVKNILKSAKESIKNKDFKEALRLCKSIIDKDKENYLAWVMTAAAAQELGNRDQALAAFHRAIQISSEQAPAWQGLAQFYEKANMQSDLVSVYSQLRKIFANDPDKSFDYSIKYSNVLAYQGKKSEAVTVLYSLFTSAQKGKDMKPVLENLAKLLADKSINDKPSDIYFKVIEASKSSQIDADIIKKIDENALIAMKRDQIDWKLILEKCFVILEDSANNENVIKTLIHIYHECLIGKIELDRSIEEKINEILKSESCKEIGMFEYTKSVSEAIREVDKLNPNNVNEFKIRLDEIEKLTLTNEHRIVKAFIETTYNSFICNFKKTIESSGQGLKFLQETIVDEIRPILQGKFLFSTGFMYFSHHDFKNAIENFKKILEIDSKKTCINEVKQEAKRYLLESYLRANEKSAAIELNRSIGKDESNSNLCDLIYSYYSKESSLETSFDLAKQVVSKYPESYDSNYMLAKIASDLILHFKELNNDEYRGICLQANIKAIKLSPYKWEAIFQLGNYYGKILKDTKKALKCYQKAFELCQNLDICGLELVDALLNEKEEDIAFNILKKAIEEIENCKWASLRLGVIYLKNGEANEAIKLFHSVIRNDPNDSNIWECLADAYLNRGSPLAALKSFAKATELNPDSTYSFYKIAHIKQSLNLFEEAVMDYFAVLNKITNHVPTFKGLGETYYELAKANIKTSSDNKYLEYIELSIKYLVKAICLRKDLCCLWKILGDCCLLITTFPRCDINISVPKSILEKDFSLPDTELCKPNKLDLLKLAEECYIICCKFKPDIGSYWYDLGLCYIYQYIFLSSPQNSAVYQMESNELTDVLLKARDCLVNSVNIEPENHEFWNLLAILYSRSELNKPHLAQHCFLKSLKANDNDAITWTNLGVFYLIHDRTGDNFLAHECFKKSQAIDPEYNVAWIGQAFIAEKVEKIEESIDLYRHSVELGLHTESQYGYARIVCKIFTHPILRGENIYKDYIEFLNAIPLASDCLVKYCDRIIDNPEAYFLCGVLYQKLNLPLTAIKYYESVFELVKDDSSEIVALARRGYARLLCEQKEYESALLQYKKIDVKNSVEDIFALAKVFYQLGKYQQCSKIFESALTVCTEKETSIVYTAMGMSQSKYNIQEAISSFFKSFQCKEKCIQSLFALCSIGLLKKDKALINAVFKELDTIVDIKYKFDIAKLKSIYFCLEKDYQNAIKCLSKYVHEHPNDAQSWIELCLCLKRSKNYDLALTVAYGTFQTSNQANLIFYECIQFLLLQKLKLSNYLDDDLTLIKMFQKTLHIFPSHISSWGSFSQFLNSYKSKAEDFKQISTRIDAALGAVQS